jgi:hypothetical protein
MSAGLGQHVMIADISRPVQIRSLATFFDQSHLPIVVEVPVKPRFYRSRYSGKGEFHWPFPIQVKAVMKKHRRVFYELRFGDNGLQIPYDVRYPQFLCLCKKSVSGVLWRGRPSLSLAYDTYLACRWVRQTLRLTEEEVQFAYHSSKDFDRWLVKWSLVGITDLLVPVPDLTSANNVRALDSCLGLIQSKTSGIYGERGEHEGMFGIRLEFTDAFNERLANRLLSKAGVECGFVVSYAEAQSLETEFIAPLKIAEFEV